MSKLSQWAKSVAILDILAGLLALQVLLILYFGGFSYLIFKTRLTFPQYAGTLIVLLLVLIFRVLIRSGFSYSKINPAQKSFLIFAVIMIVYLGNHRTLDAVDTIPARYLPVSIIRTGDLNLDEYNFLHRYGTPPFLKEVGGHYVSDYPVGAAILAVPVCIPSALGPIRLKHPFWKILEKLPASLFVGLSAVLLWLTLRKLTDGFWSLLITLLYAFGTSSFSVSSQGMWQHGAGQLCIAAALYCLVQGLEKPQWYGYAGFPMSMAVVCRPTNAILLLPLILYVLLRSPRQFLMLILTAIPPAVFQLWYNAYYFGNPFRMQWTIHDTNHWATPLGQGLISILFSPGRGLLIYSPFFLFSIAGVLYARKDSEGGILLRYLLTGVIATLLLCSKWTVWWGGETFGPRLLADLTPPLALMLYPLAPAFSAKRWMRIAFLCCGAWSVTAHFIGAYCSDPQWGAKREVDLHPQLMWNWEDNQLVDPPKRWIVRNVLPHLGEKNTREDTQILAEYHMGGLLEGTTNPKGRIHFELDAENLGNNIWLADAPKQGGVHLIIRYRQHTNPPMIQRERVPIIKDVFPRETCKLEVFLWRHLPRGFYHLDIGLATGSQRIEDAGTAPLELGLRSGPAGQMQLVPISSKSATLTTPSVHPRR
ncbi:MAG TPA: glycosyltransferase family 39 protein [Acidobacteriota bacterium]|nr:glycosyltransferase family 39 protein [Acidobacteriota bacterium]